MARSTVAEFAPVLVENRMAAGPFLLLCDHASSEIPPSYGNLGLAEEARSAHIAWDPGALGVARGLKGRLDATLIATTVSRLVYDVNRPPNAASAMPERSEVHDIPGNANLGTPEKLARTEGLYVPYQQSIFAEVARRFAQGRPPVLVAVHSFTPVFHGKPRAVELGVIHDADPSLARAVVAEARSRLPLATELNQPYDAADGVTHTLRLHATPYGLRNVMIEIRNDLIKTSEAQEDMAAKLAPVLISALAACAAPARGVA